MPLLNKINDFLTKKRCIKRHIATHIIAIYNIREDIKKGDTSTMSPESRSKEE